MESTLDNVSLLVEHLEEGDFEYLHNYISKVRNLALSSSERRKILTLADSYQNSSDEMGGLLVNLALSTLDKALLEDIEIAFSGWNNEMRQAGLRYLDRLAITSSIDLYAKLLLNHRSEIVQIPLDKTREDKQLLLRFLTKTIDCLNNSNLKEEYYSLTLDVIDIAAQSYINKLKENLIADLIIASASLSKYRHQFGEYWIWSHPLYLQIRELSCLLLELAGRIGDENFVSPLRSFMRIKDMRIRYFTAVSIIRLRGQVRKTDFLSIASSPEMRNTLYRALEKMGKLEHFPDQYLSREFFAESQMVEWLKNSKFLGRVPEEIELSCIFDTNDGDVKYEWYLFRFKSTKVGFEDRGFMAGVAGPYLKNGPQTPEGGSLTFSCFENFNTRSPQEHIEQIFSVLQSQVK